MIFLHDVKKSIRQKKLFWSIKQEKWHNTRIPRSNFIVHKNHIWNLSEIHECFWCVLSDDENEKMIMKKLQVRLPKMMKFLESCNLLYEVPLEWNKTGNPNFNILNINFQWRETPKIWKFIQSSKLFIYLIQKFLWILLHFNSNKVSPF